jgi:ferredoxin/flavodoxin---NADP+ reductase
MFSVQLCVTKRSYVNSLNIIRLMYHEITQIRFLTETTFVVRMNREGMKFTAGQRIIVGLKGEMNQRDYSIYSGENDADLEILVREVLEGTVSPQLIHCRTGQLLDVNGPFGSFFPDPAEIYSRKYIFIASGTGISPFHSIIRSHPQMDYMLFHGVRYINEAYESDHYDPARYVLCTSQESYHGKQGRVTSFLSRFPVKNDMLFFLCGNGGMIYEVSKNLRDRGIPAENIITEIYF